MINAREIFDISMGFAVLGAIIFFGFIMFSSKQKLLKVEFEEIDSLIITVWLDDGGKIVKSDIDSDYWKDQIVINPQNLTVGGLIVIYDLKSAKVDRNAFIVIKVKQEN